MMKPGKEDEGAWSTNPQNAFLGPQLWDRKLSFSKLDQDLKRQNYRYSPLHFTFLCKKIKVKLSIEFTKKISY